VVAGTAVPGGAGGPGQDLVEGIAGDVADLATVPGLERNPVDRVGAVPGDVGESGVFVDTKVVGVVDGGGELGVTGGVEGPRVDRDAHEDFLGGRTSGLPGARQDSIEETWRIVQPLLDHPPRIQPYQRVDFSHWWLRG
jgi:hypothetical protein